MLSQVLAISKVFKPGDYRISTWLLMGATLQCLLISLLPRNISLLPPLAFLTYRFLRSYLIATGSLPNPIASSVTHGRQTWRMPSTDDSTDPNSSGTIVVLVLSAHWTHPNGNFSPGSAIVGGYFQKMWRDAEVNREKYGFLGNTPAMTVENSDARDDAQGKTTVYLSYWSSLEGLHKFAHAEAHMKGQLWWEKGAMDEFPHIGVMHETYEVPKGNWENVFHNFRPFGIANAKLPVKVTSSGDEQGEKKESVEWVSGLKSADARGWKTMYGRMGRRPGTRSAVKA